MNLYLAVSLASTETFFETTAVIDHLMILQACNFVTQFFNIQIRSILSCQKLFDRTVKKTKLLFISPCV